MIDHKDLPHICLMQSRDNMKRRIFYLRPHRADGCHKVLVGYQAIANAYNEGKASVLGTSWHQFGIKWSFPNPHRDPYRVMHGAHLLLESRFFQCLHSQSFPNAGQFRG